MSIGTTWGEFFDQVLHLDGERMLKFRQAVGLPGFNRLIRLAGTTCGDDAKAEAGLTEDLIRGVTQPVLAIFGEHSPFLATADYLAEHLPHCENVRVAGASTAPGREPRDVRRAGLEVLAVGPAVGTTGEESRMSTNRPTVLLTGAANGIGRATALALAERGTPLALIDRDGPALASLAQDLKARARPSPTPRST